VLAPAAPSPLAFSVGPTTASPNPVARGQSVAIGTAVRAAGSASDIIVDLEIDDAQGRQVAQRVFSEQSSAAGQTRSYTWTWPVGGSRGTGTYPVKNRGLQRELEHPVHLGAQRNDLPSSVTTIPLPLGERARVRAP
jgi:hypothetical protein